MKPSKTLPNMAALAKACKKLAIPFSVLDGHSNLVEVRLGRPFFFCNHSTPFNDTSLDSIAKDKEFTSKILKNRVRMPETSSYFDPNSKPEVRHYRVFKDLRAIVAHAESRFPYPMVIKRNSGARGSNVFLCRSRKESLSALKKIYRKDSPNYDFLALAQAAVNIAREFRVVTFRGTVILAYEKDLSKARFTGNLSPLHWKNAKAVLVSDRELLSALARFIKPVFATLPFEFAAFDIAKDQKGDFWLFEINTKPGFDFFARDCGQNRLVEMYKNILLSLKLNPSWRTEALAFFPSERIL